MSITTSPAERQQAAESLVDKAEAQLLEDLGYWTVAMADHLAAFERLTEQRGRESDQFLEAKAWTQLLGDELRARRRPISRGVPIED